MKLSTFRLTYFLYYFKLENKIQSSRLSQGGYIFFDIYFCKCPHGFSSSVSDIQLNADSEQLGRGNLLGKGIFDWPSTVL